MSGALAPQPVCNHFLNMFREQPRKFPGGLSSWRKTEEEGWWDELLFGCTIDLVLTLSLIYNPLYTAFTLISRLAAEGCGKPSPCSWRASTCITWQETQHRSSILKNTKDIREGDLLIISVCIPEGQGSGDFYRNRSTHRCGFSWPPSA